MRSFPLPAKPLPRSADACASLQDDEALKSMEIIPFLTEKKYPMIVEIFCFFKMQDLTAEGWLVHDSYCFLISILQERIPHNKGERWQPLTIDIGVPGRYSFNHVG